MKAAAYFARRFFDYQQRTEREPHEKGYLIHLLEEKNRHLERLVALRETERDDWEELADALLVDLRAAEARLDSLDPGWRVR